MSALVSTIEIDRPPAQVFAYATDPERFPEWQRDVTGVRVEGQSRFVTTRRFARAERTMTQEVVRNDPPRTWAARGLDGPIRPSASITVEPLDDGQRSRVTFTLQFEGHGLGVALLPLVRRQAENGAPVSYRNLKQLLESRG
jgi:uncharacterized protein YndB with AHSA1/START domain